MTAQQHRTMRLVSLCTAVITLVVYLGTLTQVHTFDALSYILDVSRKPWQQLFHPHHLAYGPLGALIASLSQTDPATALQVANAIAGSIGSGLLCATVYRRWFRVDVALLAAFSCAFSYAYWYYAVEVEVYTLATLCIIAVLWLAMDPAPARVRWRVGLAVALAGAVLFHQTNALLAIPLVVRAWPDLRAGGLARRGWLIAGAGGAAEQPSRMCVMVSPIPSLQVGAGILQSQRSCCRHSAIGAPAPALSSHGSFSGWSPMACSSAGGNRITLSFG